MQEFFPKEIEIDPVTGIATVTLNSHKIMEDIMTKYTQMINYRNPEYILWKSQPYTAQELMQQGYLLFINFKFYI